MKSLKLFGSALTGTTKSTSDADPLIEFEPGNRVGYFGLSRSDCSLSDKLGVSVDLMTAGELSQHFCSEGNFIV